MEGSLVDKGRSRGQTDPWSTQQSGNLTPLWWNRDVKAFRLPHPYWFKKKINDPLIDQMWSDSHCSLFFTSYIWFSNLVPQFFLFNVSNVSQEINDAHKYLIYWVLPHNWWLTHIALTSYSHPPRTAICAICGLAEARNERAVIPSPTALRLTRNEITARRNPAHTPHIRKWKCLGTNWHRPLRNILFCKLR